MINDEIFRLQSKLQLAEKRMLSGESNVTLTEVRSRLQEKYDRAIRPDSLYPNGTQKTYEKQSR